MTDTEGMRRSGDVRRHARFKLDTEISVYSRTCGLIRGHTVDISESGICAMFKLEVPIAETVQMDITLPTGTVEIYAVVRHRNAFRYGLEFVEARSAPELELVRRACRLLALQKK